MPQANRGERRLDRIRRSQVNPVLRREIIKGQQLLAILSQTVTGFGILRRVLFQEVIPSRQRVRLRFRLPDLAGLPWSQAGSDMHTYRENHCPSRA